MRANVVCVREDSPQIRILNVAGCIRKTKKNQTLWVDEFLKVFKEILTYFSDTFQYSINYSKKKKKREKKQKNQKEREKGKSIA